MTIMTLLMAFLGLVTNTKPTGDHSSDLLQSFDTLRRSYDVKNDVILRRIYNLQFFRLKKLSALVL